MKQSKVLIAALIAMSPAALFAADPATASPGQGQGDWFKGLDTNGDGAISQEEAQAAGARHLLRSFDKIDRNHDGMITLEELHEARMARRAEMEAKFAARWKAADTNGDGTLSREEAQAAMPMLAQHFDAIDSNKDGQISVEELKAAHQRLGKRMPHRHPNEGAPSDPTQSQEPQQS